MEIWHLTLLVLVLAAIFYGRLNRMEYNNDAAHSVIGSNINHLSSRVSRLEERTRTAELVVIAIARRLQVDLDGDDAVTGDMGRGKEAREMIDQ